MTKRVDAPALEQYRRHPATATQDDLVVCLECGLLVRRLTRSPRCHARYTHNLDAAAYLAKWPGAPLQSAAAVADERDKRELYLEINADELKAKRREYSQRPEVRERENWAQRKRWPGWYAKHKEQESKRRSMRHAKNREKDNERGQAWYRENLERERAKRRQRQAEMRRLARLVSKGRPRKDATRQLVIKLKAGGRSWQQIANQLNYKNPKTGKPLTAGAYRMLAERES